MRQGEAQKGSVAKPTPIQMIMGIVAAKTMLETELNKRLGAEQVTASWCEQKQDGLLCGCNEGISCWHSNAVLATHIVRPINQGPTALARASLCSARL